MCKRLPARGVCARVCVGVMQTPGLFDEALQFLIEEELTRTTCRTWHYDESSECATSEYKGWLATEPREH